MIYLVCLKLMNFYFCFVSTQRKMNKGGYKKWGQMQKKKLNSAKKFQPYPKKESLMKWVLVGPQKKLHGVVTKKKVVAIVSEVAEDLEMQVVPAPEEFDQRMFFSMRARLAHFDETGKPFPAGGPRQLPRHLQRKPAYSSGE
jgi:hypothetical protein